jgi:broad specificity phosphatase PhoE
MSQIDALIGEITDQTERELLRVEWEYGSVVKRDNTTVERFGAALGMTALQIDEAFREAALIG